MAPPPPSLPGRPPFRLPAAPLHLLGTSPTRPGDLGPAPPRPPGFVESLRIPLLPPLPLLFPQNLIPKSQGPGPQAQEQSDLQGLRPSLAKKHKMVRQGQAPGDGQEFSMNLFFCRQGVLIASHPRRVVSFPPPPPALPQPVVAVGNHTR